MFCPTCGDEFRSGFTRCNDCGVDLVAEPPAQDLPPEAFAMATVLETGDQSLIAVAKSLLDSAGIPSIARNERLQNLFGWGSVGTGYNAVTGPIRLQVLTEDEGDARELLTALPVSPDDAE